MADRAQAIVRAREAGLGRKRLKQLIRGDLRAGLVAAAPAGHAQRRRFAQLKRRAREQEPSSLDEQVVRTWLRDLDCAVKAKAGIRIFHDYVRPATRSSAWLDELLPVEKAYRSIEPFASLGQQTHLVCRPRLCRLPVTTSMSNGFALRWRSA